MNASDLSPEDARTSRITAALNTSIIFAEMRGDIETLKCAAVLLGNFDILPDLEAIQAERAPLPSNVVALRRPA